MNYYELKLTLTPDTEENRDILSALLGEIGFESFTESEGGLNAYIPENLWSEEALSDLLETLPLPDTEVKYHIGYVREKNWNEEWEKNFFQPILIDDRLVIHSSFHRDIPKLPYDIVIDPKMAFGTGHHATTSLMASYLLDAEVSGASLLDMGCGTAVLAILARMKGAGPVTAIDIDHWAYENAIENCQLNHTTDIQILLGDASLLGNDTYDIIFANINRNILLTDMGIYARCMQTGADLYLSGFYQEDMEAILKEAGRWRLEFVSYREKDNWTAMHLRKG